MYMYIDTYDDWWNVTRCIAARDSVVTRECTHVLTTINMIAKENIAKN